MPTCPIPGFEGFTEPEGLGTNGCLILGEAAGENEVEDGLPFRPNAPAGSVLERALRRCGFNRNQFVVFNVVPSRPPKNHLEGAKYEAEAIAWGLQYVREVVAKYKPSVVLALGNIALKATTGLSGILENRGYPCSSSAVGIPVISTLHPAFLRRGAMSYLSVLMHDLKFAVALAGALRQYSRTVEAPISRDWSLPNGLRNDGQSNRLRTSMAHGPGLSPVRSYGEAERELDTRSDVSVRTELMSRSERTDPPRSPSQVINPGSEPGPLDLVAHATAAPMSLKGPQALASPAVYTHVSFWSPVLWREVTYEIPSPLPALYDTIESPGYQCHPTEDQAEYFAKLVEFNPDVWLAYDIETPYVKGEENDPESNAITSVQFSLAPETGIFMPWRAPFDEIARRILALRNPKIGANNWRFDDPILQANGCVINGQNYDLRWMWKHLQPDLSGGLQFINSFYNPGFGVWKHLSSSQPERYGIRDVDVLQRII